MWGYTCQKGNSPRLPLNLTIGTASGAMEIHKLRFAKADLADLLLLVLFWLTSDAVNILACLLEAIAMEDQWCNTVDGQCQQDLAAVQCDEEIPLEISVYQDPEFAHPNIKLDGCKAKSKRYTFLLMVVLLYLAVKCHGKLRSSPTAKDGFIVAEGSMAVDAVAMSRFHRLLTLQLESRYHKDFHIEKTVAKGVVAGLYGSEGNPGVFVNTNFQKEHLKLIQKLMLSVETRYTGVFHSVIQRITKWCEYGMVTRGDGKHVRLAREMGSSVEVPLRGGPNHGYCATISIGLQQASILKQPPFTMSQEV